VVVASDVITITAAFQFVLFLLQLLHSAQEYNVTLLQTVCIQCSSKPYSCDKLVFLSQVVNVYSQSGNESSASHNKCCNTSYVRNKTDSEYVHVKVFCIMFL
jgi:hypothetical protein